MQGSHAALESLRDHLRTARSSAEEFAELTLSLQGQLAVAEEAKHSLADRLEQRGELLRMQQQQLERAHERVAELSARLTEPPRAPPTPAGEGVGGVGGLSGSFIRRDEAESGGAKAELREVLAELHARQLQVSSPQHSHTHTQTQTHTHRHTHADTHTDTHTQTHTQTHSLTQTQTHTHKHTHTHTHTDTQTHTQTHRHTHTEEEVEGERVCVRVCVCVCERACA